MNFTFDFAGKNVMVFGGTSGICLGVAKTFVDAGATVAVIGRKPDKLQTAVEALSKAGRPTKGYSLDVRDFGAVEAAVEDFHGTVGALDVVISGAAGNFPVAAASLSSNGFKSVVDIDLLGTFHVMRAVYAKLKKPGASVINISAPQAFIPMGLQAHVCAAKAGVDMLTKTLALEWGPAGIRANSVVPGPIIGTEGMARLAPTPQAVQAVVDSVPLRRMGVPDEVADACLFLGSDAARYVSGTVLCVDGGWAAAGAHLVLSGQSGLTPVSP